ncbi:glycosyl hydrolase family 92 [Kribbella orskensis]|uniref:Glycosyl hydrolase family 92 n=1 Tax=Kribbella orskensis TaxID=2512216 RepID=A0ABY2BF33_9ACTN|nr:glycosyl hydrolase family 92 [Kribbella sp. VKM Ac-2500]TCO16773.1 glycosyl hydrolase family 92 [Kribbella orskensis]
MGYQRTRKADGTWQPGFTPSTDVGFAQGSSATYTWMVPQGRLRTGSGDERQRSTAGRFFHDDAGNWAVKGGSALRYDPTNEPGLHTPWLYNGLGVAWKTQATTREIVDTVYGIGPSGLPGNADLGSLSACVFAASGCSRRRRAGRRCWSGVPCCRKFELRRSNGVRLTVEAPGTSYANQYVQSLTLNGKPRAEPWLPESFITRGGRISARMGAAPSNWGTAPVDHY